MAEENITTFATHHAEEERIRDNSSPSQSVGEQANEDYSRLVPP